MPTHDEALIIAKHIDELPKDVIYTMESYEKQVLLSDKYQANCFYQILLECQYLAFIDDIKEATYPIVIKTKFGNSAKGVFFPKKL